MGVSIEFSSELRSLKVSEDHVIAEIAHDNGGESVVEETRTSWLFGADGARSTVRKALGLAFEGETQDTDIAFGDIKVEGEPLKVSEKSPFDYFINLFPTYSSTGKIGENQLRKCQLNANFTF